MTDINGQRETVLKFTEIFTNEFKEGRFKSITFSKLPKGDILKIKGTPKKIRGENIVQLEYSMTEGRVSHRNVQNCEIAFVTEEIVMSGARRADLHTAGIDASLLTSSKGKITFIKKNNTDTVKSAFESSNERGKNYILSGNEEFMKFLGISDKNGRVHDKKQPKFRQINRFCEQIRDVLKNLPKSGKLHIADLCCGKSYLSFAVYYFFTEIIKREVDMTCVDLKKSVIDFCSETASALGFYGMNFICGDISKYDPHGECDLVISLHACDVATDIVLDCAVRNRAKVILSTPCCQHELSSIVDSPELEFMTRYSIIKQKLCSTATDALRLARLEAAGYRTDAIEFIDPEDTPKNTLIRGILKTNYDVSSKEAREKLDFYKRSYRFMTGRDPSPLFFENSKGDLNNA